MNKSQFRLNVEGAMLNANSIGILSARHVFVDRNKCSDRIKFAFKEATPEQLSDIHREVQKCYPNNDVHVYNNEPKGFMSPGGVAISIKHAPGERM